MTLTLTGRINSNGILGQAVDGTTRLGTFPGEGSSGYITLFPGTPALTTRTARGSITAGRTYGLQPLDRTIKLSKESATPPPVDFEELVGINSIQSGVRPFPLTGVPVISDFSGTKKPPRELMMLQPDTISESSLPLIFMSKILLALQFWNGDRDVAMRLARTIADMQPGRCENADFLFMSRFDCAQHAPTIQAVAQRFNVFQATNRRRGDGWPHGCNELWFGTIDHIYSKMVAKQMPNYKAILTFESDSVPLAANWVNELHRTWDEAAPAKVVGPMIPGSGGGHDHINGNMMVSGDLSFLRWVSREVGGCHARGGWDYLLAPQFKKRGWAGTPGMRSDYRLETMTREYFDELSASGVFFHHGTKDGSALALVQERFVR